MVQGRTFSNEQLGRITSLLASTDLAIPQIAERMGCSRSAVAQINRKFQIREYRGQRSRWSVAGTRTEQEVNN